MNILVVDDHPLYRSGVVYALQNTGQDVHVVECAALTGGAWNWAAVLRAWQSMQRFEFRSTW